MKSSIHNHPMLKEQEAVKSKHEQKLEVSPEEDAAADSKPGVRSLLQLEVDVSCMEWHATYISADNAMKGAFRDYTDQAVILATKLTLENLLSSLNVQSDATFSAECWLMDVALKEVAYSTNRRRSSSYDTLRPGMGSESYILHQSLCYRKTKPPKFGGSTMDTRRASSKDVVLQAAVDYANQEIKGNMFTEFLLF